MQYELHVENFLERGRTALKHHSFFSGSTFKLSPIFFQNGFCNTLIILLKKESATVIRSR